MTDKPTVVLPIGQAIPHYAGKMSDPMKVEKLREELLHARCRSDARYTVKECYEAMTCGCTIGLTLQATDQ